MTTNVIFDLGRVLIDWQPKHYLQRFFKHSPTEQLVYEHIFGHPDWLEIDRGTLLETDALIEFSRRTGLEHQLISEMMDYVYDSLTPLPLGIELLYWAKEQGCTLYCLSNMSIKIHQTLMSKYSFFNEFQDMLVSGYVKLIKPQPEIYQSAIHQFAIQPDRSLFIDDREDNIAAAQKSGLHGVVYGDCTESVYQVKTKVRALAEGRL